MRMLSPHLMVPRAKRFIFVYHDVAEFDAAHFSRRYSTTVSAFHAQIDHLAQLFSFVPLEEVVRPGPMPSGGRVAALTFDDGFLSVRDAILPYLSARGIPFAIFLNRQAVQDNFLSYGPDLECRHLHKVYLDEEDVRRLHAAGVTVGSHSATHPLLAEVSDDRLPDEILGNKAYLEGLVGAPVTHFALPFGKRQHYDDRVLRYCRQAGHDYIYSTNPTFFDDNDLQSSALLLPRVEISNEPVETVGFVLNRPLLKRVEL